MFRGPKELSHRSRRLCWCWILSSLIGIASSSASVRAGDLSEPVDLSFRAQIDGTTQKYVQMLPKDYDAVQQYDVLIAFHGHGKDRWQYAKGDFDEANGVRDVAARHHMILISPDYRAATSWMGPKAEADLVQLIAAVRVHHKVRKVFLVGASMGGTSVLIFAALHPDLVDGVSSQNGTGNMLEYPRFQYAISESYGGDKLQNPGEYQKRSPELVPEKLSMPVAFTVGGRDTLVAPGSVRRLAKSLKELKRPVLLIDRENTGHTTNFADTVAALEFVIRASPEIDRDNTQAK